MIRRRRGLLLLELVIALAIFVTVGTLILSSIRQAILSTQHARDMVRAEDFAASVLALIETDLDTPENLSGPLPEWDAEEGYFSDVTGGSGAFGFASAAENWIIDIETAPGGIPGFTSVIVTVSLDQRPTVSATRESLVPLAASMANGGTMR
jgi:type II secretory pathway pseudopilin PulG